MKKHTIFVALGLEPRDIMVYEALYNTERSSLRTLASLTKMNRGTVYEVVKKLTGLGLITFSQTGERRKYSAASPEVLLALLRERQDQLQTAHPDVQAYVAAMRKGRGHTAGFIANFYEGQEGVAAILRDVLQTLASQNDASYSVISSQEVSAYLYANFRSFTRQRIAMKIFVRVLADGGSTETAALSERRILHAGDSSHQGYIILYGTKTALISLGEANTLSGIVIDDPGIAGMQRMIFDNLWEATVS